MQTFWYPEFRLDMDAVMHWVSLFEKASNTCTKHMYMYLQMIMFSPTLNIDWFVLFSKVFLFFFLS